MRASRLGQQPQAAHAVRSTLRNARSVSVQAKRDVFYRPKGDVLLDDMATVQLKSRERPVIQWYPGHIAKAERQLKEQLSKVPPAIMYLHCESARCPYVRCFGRGCTCACHAKLGLQ